jgi:hypothetical protein
MLSLGAPDCPVRQAGSGEVAALGTLTAVYGYNSPDCPVGRSQANSSLSGIHRRRTAIIHRTVRCTPDCPVSQRSAGPTVGRAICAGHVAEPPARRGHRSVRWAPVCPVCTGHIRCDNDSQAANGRLLHFWKGIGHRIVSGVHRTVRCASRQKARSAFLDCSQRLLAALGL